jgi:hypothetical protein
MTKMRSAWCVAGLALMFLAGCHGDLDDPCSFLTAGEVKEAFDADRVQMVKRNHVSLVPDPEDHGGKPRQVCILTASDVANFTMFHVRIITPAEFAREKARVTGKERQEAEDLPGIAEQAFWNRGTAAALKKGHAVILTSVFRKATAVGLLKKAAGRLP